MPSTHFKFVTLAASLVGLFSGSAFSQATSLAVYYGQGSNQLRLSEFCSNTNIDIIPIGFVTKFANTGTGGVIETNFGNQCFGPAATGTNFVFDCPNLAADILTCQGLGKKILLSIGGGLPAGSYFLTSSAQAQQAASDIFSAFGPVDSSWTLGRPFGDAVVDGFDLDLEQGAEQGGNGQIYAEFAQALRDKFATTSKSMVLTAAPQCIFPDAQLNVALSSVAFDFIFVQFYNNPSCRPSNYVSSDAQTKSSQLTNFLSWNSLAAANPSGSAKWFLGLLASPSSADYTTQAQLSTILGAVQPMSNFGGIMLWEMTTASSDKNVNGVTYIDQVKHNLQGNPDLPTSSSSSAIPSPSATPFATTSSSPPGETHLAVNPQCNQWHLIKAGDTCSTIVDQSAGTLTLADFQAWNEQAAGSCGNMWANTWACVGLDSTTSSSSSSVIPSSSSALPSSSSSIPISTSSAVSSTSSDISSSSSSTSSAISSSSSDVSSSSSSTSSAISSASSDVSSSSSSAVSTSSSSSASQSSSSPASSAVSSYSSSSSSSSASYSSTSISSTAPSSTSSSINVDPTLISASSSTSSSKLSGSSSSSTLSSSSVYSNSSATYKWTRTPASPTYGGGYTASSKSVYYDPSETSLTNPYGYHYSSTVKHNAHPTVKTTSSVYYGSKKPTYTTESCTETTSKSPVLKSSQVYADPHYHTTLKKVSTASLKTTVTATELCTTTLVSVSKGISVTYVRTYTTTNTLSTSTKAASVFTSTYAPVYNQDKAKKVYSSSVPASLSTPVAPTFAATYATGNAPAKNATVPTTAPSASLYTNNAQTAGFSGLSIAIVMGFAAIMQL